MSDHAHKRIPVNLIAGPLGVGKTTTINHLLEHRPAGERWAVLVNEYGLVGLDAALMESSDELGGRSGVEVREVAGGCICCSAGFMFEMSLVLLLQRRPDRLLIEPTGLAALSGILDTLDRQGIRESVDVRSVVCLLDPGRLADDLLRDEVLDQVEAADVLLASRSDLATAEQLRAFNSWATGLFPSKRFVGHVERGGMAPALLDLGSNREAAVQRRGHRHEDVGAHDHHTDNHVHGHDEQAKEMEPTLMTCDEAHPIQRRTHQSPHASTVGWVCWSGLLFDADRVAAWLRRLARLPGVRRTKAVLRTTEGWWGFNVADGVEEVRPSGYRRDSRIELVIEGALLPDTDALQQELRGCLPLPLNTPSPAQRANDADLCLRNDPV